MKVVCALVVFSAVFAVAFAAYGDSEDCKDIGNNCEMLKDAGSCIHLDTLLYCEATCGVCGTPLPTPTPKPEIRATPLPVPEGECRDTRPRLRCAYLANNGRCGEVQDECRFTCGLCVPSPTPTPPQTGDCFDTLPKSTCSYRAGLGHCAGVREECAATCGYCIPREAEHECEPRKTTVCIMADTNLVRGHKSWDELVSFVGRTIGGIYGSFPVHDQVRFAGVIFGDTVNRAKGPTRQGHRVDQLFENFAYHAYSASTTSRIDLALGMCGKVFERKPRDDEDQVAILLSDGLEGDQSISEDIYFEADKLKDAGVKIYSVGINVASSQSETLLKEVSGLKDAADELYTVAGAVHDFNSFAGELVTEQCRGDA